MKRDRNLLVIDWDFFFHNKLEGDIVYGNERHNDVLLYDWGHREAKMFIEGYLWESRAIGFLINDLPLPMTTGLEKDFWHRFRIAKSAKLFIADSNACAAEDQVEDRIGSVSLFDAHHDSGYRPESLGRTHRGIFQCEDWMLLYEMRRAYLEMFYPPWRTRGAEIEPKPIARVKQRVFDPAGCYDDLLYHRVFICRSGAWTPPWIDADWWNFVQACPVASSLINLDGVKQREWNAESLQKLLTQHNLMMENQQRRIE